MHFIYYLLYGSVYLDAAYKSKDLPICSKQQKHSMKRSISRAGFRTGQAEQMPRGLHICLVTFSFLNSRVGWASTAPLL